MSPFLDIMEVHDLVRATESPERVLPIPVHGTLRIPFYDLANAGRDLALQGVDDKAAD